MIEPKVRGAVAWAREKGFEEALFPGAPTSVTEEVAPSNAPRSRCSSLAPNARGRSARDTQGVESRL
jgi:hypothetical protein